MKIITTILLFIMVLGCNAQEPDTIICYSVEDMELERQLRYDTIEYFENLITFQDSIINAGLDIRKDTFSITIEGVNDGVFVGVNKVGSDVWVNIVDGFKRINADYINNRRSIMLMDSTYTVGSMFIR